MKYYKWVWSEERTLHQIPGFVWADKQTATENYKQFKEWTWGETENPSLYLINEVEPTQFPIAFSSRLSYNPSRPEPKQLSQHELEEAMEYFSNLPVDFFSTKHATEKDELLFLEIAATLRVLKSAHNPVLDEYFIGCEATMYKTT